MNPLKKLLAQKRALDVNARAKLTEITDQTPEADQRRIETEHAAILAEITALDTKIAEARAAQTRDDEDGDERATDDNDESDDDSEDDEDADADADKKRKRAAGKTLTRKMMAEMAQIDVQARALGVDLDLPKCIENGTKPDAMRKRMFDKLAEKSRTAGPRGSAVEIVRDESEGVAQAMEIALIRRSLLSGGHDGKRMDYAPKNLAHKKYFEQHRAQAEQYIGLSLVEIAATCINYKGRGLITTHRAQEIFETAFNQRAFNTTSDFPSIFQNVLNKALLSRYELEMPTYREISVERPFNDFRPHPQIRAGEFPQLQSVSESGELKYGSSADGSESVSVAPYGVIFTISRQMLVNDDLGAIDQILGSAGDTVLVFENSTFFTMFNANPTLSTDSVAVFASGHGNLAGSGAAPSVATIGAARQALRGMKSLSNLYLNVPPRIILTGPVQETVADQMVTAITPTLTTSVNPFSGRLRSVSDANITGNEWYVMTEPGRIPCFIYGFLNGSNGPRVRTFEPFGVQGIKVSLEHDFGTGAIDYRGAYKNPGS